MNSLTTVNMTDPYGKVSECIQFTIDDITDPFVLEDIMAIGRQYTFSLWLMSDSTASLSVVGDTFAVTSAWSKYHITFTSGGTDLLLNFDTAGVYYIYHPQLEIGTIATDWTPAPEDVDEGISDAADIASTAKKTSDENAESVKSIREALVVIDDKFSTLVKGPDGQTLMTQDEHGWTFSISEYMAPYIEQLDGTTKTTGDLSGSLGDTNDTVNKLSQAVSDLGFKTAYIRMTEYDGKPCLELGDSASSFKVRITNEDIQFVDGNFVPAYVSNQKLMIEQAEVKNDLQFGGFAWRKRANGNMGIIWKGES